MHSCKHTHMYMYRHTCSAYKRWMWPMCMLLNRGTSSKRRFTLSSGMRKGSFSTIGRSACVEHVCVCVCVCVCAHVCTDMWVCVCAYKYVSVCACVCTYIYTHKHTHNTHTWTHARTCLALLFCLIHISNSCQSPHKHTPTHAQSDTRTHNQTCAPALRSCFARCTSQTRSDHPHTGKGPPRTGSCAWAWKSSPHCKWN
jgi:hypothetical protein